MVEDVMASAVSPVTFSSQRVIGAIAQRASIRINPLIKVSLRWSSRVALMYRPVGTGQSIPRWMPARCV